MEAGFAGDSGSSSAGRFSPTDGMSTACAASRSSSSSSREPSHGFAFPLFFFFFFSSFSASSHDRICLSSGVVLVPREDNALRRETRPRRRASFSSAERGRGEEWRGAERASERGREVWVAFSTAFGFGRFSECTRAREYRFRWSVHGWGTTFFSSLFELYLFLLLPFVSLPFFWALLKP